LSYNAREVALRAFIKKRRVIIERDSYV